MSDLEVTSKYMDPVLEIIENGLTIAEESSIKKSLLAILLSLGEQSDTERESDDGTDEDPYDSEDDAYDEEDEEDDDPYEEEDDDEEAVPSSNKPEYDINNPRLRNNIDAYQSAQVMMNIIEKTKNVFVHKAISRALSTKGLFEKDDMIMAQEAFVAGFLMSVLCKVLTKLDTIPDAAEVKTTGDFTKLFLIGAGISWIGTKGRYQIKKLQAEAEKEANEANMQQMQGGGIGGEEEFAETPGKKNINAKSAQQTAQNVKESTDNVSPKIDKNETQSADVAAGEELNQRKMELLTLKDYFIFVNNFLLVPSEIQTISVTLFKNLRATNFEEFLTYVSVNPWEDQYGLKSLISPKSSQKKPKRKKKKDVPSLPLESLAYEYLSLLTLIAKDLTELYIEKRFEVQQAKIAEEEEAVAAEEQQAAAMEQESQEVELAKGKAEVKEKEAKAEATKKSANKPPASKTKKKK